MKLNNMVSIAAALLLSGGARADDLTDRVKQHFLSGQKHYSLGEFEQAAEEFREAYRLHAEPALLFNIAQALRQNGKLEEARFQYSQFLIYRPDATNRPAVEKLISDLDAAIVERARRDNEAAQYPEKYLEKDAPSFEALEPGQLQGQTLCVAPFFVDGRRAKDISSGGSHVQVRDELQTILVDLAKSSPALKSAIPIGKEAPICGIDDLACLTSLGARSGCTAVLAGRATREDNGFTLRARLVDAKKSKLLAKASQVIATDDDTAMVAWAEGQACRGLKVKCEGQVQVDADRPGMRIVIDDQPVARTPSLAPGLPEAMAWAPGLYKLRATIGTSQSREGLLAVRRNQTVHVYVRQTKDGAIALTVQGESKPGDAPAPSAELVKQGPSAIRIAGIVAASLGAVAEGIAFQQYAHSQSLANGAADSYSANGYYKPADVAAVGSAKSAHSNSTILAAVGAGLLVAGAVLVVAF
jgi:tetratricopeptide (TPR) repeat protein